MKTIQTIILTLTLLCSVKMKLQAQDTTWSNVVFQVDEKSIFKDRIISNDSTKLLVEYAFDSLNFKIEEFSAHILGNKSMIAINLPDSILSNSLYIKISSPGRVACVRCPASSDYVSLLSYHYKPFDYYFNSNPEGASLFLIPLYECKKIFKTSDFSKIQLTESIMPNISSYKISMKPTPLTFKVVSQPYVAIFVIKNNKTNMLKMTKELIRPNSNFPDLNKVTSIIE